MLSGGSWERRYAGKVSPKLGPPLGSRVNFDSAGRPTDHRAASEPSDHSAWSIALARLLIIGGVAAVMSARARWDFARVEIFRELLFHPCPFSNGSHVLNHSFACC